MTTFDSVPPVNDENNKNFFGKYIQSLQSCISGIDLESLERAAEAITKSCQRRNTIYCIGNGGSAATASHLSTDLFFGRRLLGEVRPKAVSLVSNVPLMTALANDTSYSDIFVEQLNGLFTSGDILIAISASGNSDNVLKAVDFVKKHGGYSVGLVGFDGGQLKGLCDFSIHVPTPIGAYELVEDAHHAICHMLAQYIKLKFKE